MTITTSSASIHHRPSPLSNYMQHLQQKNNNKPTIQPIKSGTAMRQLQRAASDGCLVREAYRAQQQQQQQQQQENNNSRLPVWKERQLRAQLQDSSNSNNGSNSHPPGGSSGGAARLAMTIQNSNTGASEIRRVPFYPHENHPALVDKHHHDQHHHRHHDQHQPQGCDPTSSSTMMSGNATCVSRSSTESSEDARSSTTDDSHNTDDRSTPEQDDDDHHHHDHQLVVSSMAIVPFTQQAAVAGVDLVQLDAILGNDDINTESLYQELIVLRNSDSGTGGSTGGYHEPQEPDIDTLTKMIDDCAARWQNSARVPSSRRRSHNHLLVIPNSNSYDTAPATTANAAPVLVVPPLSRKQEVIMAQQRAEIKYLRARLASQDEDSADASADEHHHFDYYPNASSFESAVTPPYPQQQHYHTGMSPPQMTPPVEQIDSVPIEHIEVAILDHDGDLCSVTSGLTNLVDLSSRMPDDATAVSYLLEKSFSRRPDAESSVCGSVQRQKQASQASQQQQERVTDQPLLLRAADGSSRQALYTGPVKTSNNTNTGLTSTPTFTGMGVLKFVETGDMYMGQVCNGEMHGQGTYTFAKKKKKRPHGKVLRGQFQNNVYVGWNPDAAFLE